MMGQRSHSIEQVAEQGARTDRLQRGETWQIFMRFVLLLPVLSLVAAAQLERWTANKVFSSSWYT